MQQWIPERAELKQLRGRLLPRVLPIESDGGVELVPGCLSIGLVADSPSGVRAVEDADLERWGVTMNELLPAAIENLRTRSTTDAWYSLRAVPGMRVYLAGDGNAGARVLILRDLIQPWPLGGVLVSVPTPDQLIAVPLDDLEQLEAFQVLVQSGRLAHELGREPVSDQVLWIDGGQIAHVHVKHGEDTVEVLPPPHFLKMIEKLAALKMVHAAGEA